MPARKSRAFAFAALLGVLPGAVGASVVLAPAAAFAEVEAYKQHMDNGVKLFADHNYPAAIAEFQAAYQLKPKASPLINVALCYKAQFKYPKAIETLEEALSKHADTLDEADKKAAEDAIAEMKALLAHVKVTVTPPEAAITVDGETQAPDAEKKIALSPGTHKIGAKLEGYTVTDQDLSVVSGDQKEIAIAMTAASAVPTPGADAKMPPKPPTRYSTPLMVMGIVVGAVGLVSGIGGVLLYATAARCPDDKTDPNYNAQICDNKGQSKAAGVGLMVVGAVGVGVGIPMFVVGSGPPNKPKAPATPAPASPPPPKAALVIGPASAALRVAF